MKNSYLFGTVVTCEARVTTLICGCKEIDPMVETIQEEDRGWPCSECGKRHRPGAAKNIRYEDCTQHAEFFRYWDGIFTGFPGRDYNSGKCPQFRITPARALSALLKGKAKSQEHFQKLIDAMAAQRGKAASRYAASACGLKAVTAVQCNQLAWAVTRYYDAKGLLGKGLANGEAKRHLQWVVVRWLFALLGVQLAAVALVVAAWVWHLPDWRTIVTLAITALGAGAFFPMFKDWFMQRRLGFANMDDE